jgi:uncharacterized cupin superfamily protein
VSGAAEGGWADAPVAVVHAAAVALADDADGVTRSLTLGPTGSGEVGLWEIDPGTAHDVEVDEVFVVVSGRATVSVVGWPDVVVGPGDVVRLRAGTATTWTVTERLRKVYVAWDGPAG